MLHVSTLRARVVVCLSMLAALLAGPRLWSAPPEAVDEAPGVARGAAEPAAEPDAKDEPAEQPEPKFLRLVRGDSGQPLMLQTSIVRFGPANGKDGPIVDLVGAVHVGEKSYYEQLNKAFADYEVVLYELVAPEGVVPVKGQAGGGGVGALQRGMKRMLELEFQLDHVDYTQKNFVHADMTPERFAESMKNRNESFFAIVMKAMGRSMAMQNSGRQPSDAEMLAALFAKDRALRLKRIMAEQFENLDGLMEVFEGPDGSTLITERNKVALEVLQKQIDGGKRRMAIFYGAGHLPDMEKRLIADFGLVEREVRWIDAWDLGDPAPLPDAQPEEPAAPQRRPQPRPAVQPVPN